MDPNATLAILRAFYRVILDKLDTLENMTPFEEDVDKLATAARDLDAWFSAGGFVLDDWVRNSTDPDFRSDLSRDRPWICQCGNGYETEGPLRIHQDLNGHLPSSRRIK